jgi:hypothetical protein
VAASVRWTGIACLSPAAGRVGALKRRCAVRGLNGRLRAFAKCDNALDCGQLALQPRDVLGPLDFVLVPSVQLYQRFLAQAIIQG